MRAHARAQASLYLMAVALFLTLVAHIVVRFDLSRWFVIVSLACIVLYVLIIGLENAIHATKDRKQNRIISEGYAEAERDSAPCKSKREANKTDAADADKPRR